MEDRIEFEEETIVEEVFSGEIDINEKRSSKQEKTHAFEIFKKATSQNINKSEYKIEWLDEDFETNKKHFRVLHTYKKKVPYKISYEEIYKGEYYLTGETISPEERRNQIFTLLREEGYDVKNEDEYEIVIPSSEDYEISQKIDFVVYHVNKEKADEEELNASKENMADDIKTGYQEMIALREELAKGPNGEKLEELSEKTKDVLESVDTIIEKRLNDYGIFEQKITNYKEKLQAAEEDMRKKEEEYQQAFEETRVLMETRDGLTEEQVEAIKRGKDKNNSKLQTISNEKEKLKSRISTIKRDLKKVQKDLEMAKMLGVSANEYLEITKSVEETEILEKIINKKGLKDQLDEILETPKRNRSKEQRRILNEVKEEAVSELAKYKLEHPKVSVLDGIQALYGIGEIVHSDGNERAVMFKPEKYENVVRKADELPHKVVGKPEVNYTPNEAPKDLEGVFETKEASKGLIDKITIFEDKDNPGKLYARLPVFARFTIPSDKSTEVRIQGTLCRQIDADVVERIKANKDNNYSPYIVNEVKEEVKTAETALVPAEYYDIKKTLQKIDEIIKGEVVDPNAKENKKEEQKKEETSLVPADYYDIKKTLKMIDEIVKGEAFANQTDTKVPVKEKKEETSLVPADYYDIKKTLKMIDEIVKGEAFANQADTKVPVKEKKEETALVPAEYYDIKKTLQKIDEIIKGETLNSTTNQDVPVPEEDPEDIIDASEIDEVSLEEVDEDTVTDETIKNEEIDNNLEEYTNNEGNIYRVTEDTRIDGVPEENEIEEMLQRVDFSEKVTIYEDKDNLGTYYVRKPVFIRFGLPPEDTIDVKINETICRRISPENVQFIRDNADNILLPSPYMVIDEQVDVKKVEEEKEEPVKTKPKIVVVPSKTEPKPVKTEPVPEKTEPTPVKTEPVPEKTEPKPVMTEPVPKKTEPKPVMTEPVPKKTEPTPAKTEPKEKKTTPVAKHKPHVEEIIAKLTKDLNIHAKDAKKFTASNIKVAKGFRQELSSGNYLYNIVHFVPAIIKFPLSLARKLFNTITLGSRGRGSMQTFKDRLEDLSEDELEVLFENYKGSQLKTDMNNQINPLVLDRLRKYGLGKVEKLNERIKKDYQLLFVKLGRIKALEHELGGDIGSGEKDALEAERKTHTKEAAAVIKDILEKRKEADNLLSSGVHGIEEDFKAVSTKLSYVGLRFGKNNNFDNELQEKLGNFGRNLNIAIENNNAEAILQNFMGLESCYYDNTDIRGSIVGKRSVGTKYYTPLAEQFDYRDDPFIRDIFTTAAVAGATLTAINAFRTNQVVAEHNRLLEEHNRDVEEINRINDETMYYVNDTGKQIAFRKFPFRDGMEANAKQDILTNAAVRERAHLDQTNWQFNDTYHQIDPAGHDAYNLFNQEVSSRIDATAIEYANGTLPYDDLFARVSQISTDAHATLTNVVDESLAILRQYAASHPQFDLSAFEQSMQYLVEHPEAVANMNQAMVDVVNMGESLSSLEAAHLEALSILPVEMSSNIIGAASASVLASTVASSLSKGPKKKAKYGNEVTAMMDEYMSQEEEEEVERTR